VPDFKLGEKLFSNCLLVHKLLATGRGEELLQRWDQISPSILLHKCQYVDHPSMLEKKVAIPTLFFLKGFEIFPSHPSSIHYILSLYLALL